jgi:hypothetical protein
MAEQHITFSVDCSPLIAALTRNSDLLERVIAGQDAALSALEKAGGKTTTTRKTKDPVVADEGKANELAAAGNEAAGAAAASDGPTVPADIDAMKAFVGTFTGVTDADQKATRIAFLRDAATALGKEKGVEGAAGTQGLMLDPAKAFFWIERNKAGLAVDFAASYDFAGDPKQDAPAPADDF